MTVLPSQICVLERGWLSSNNILFLEGDAATLVDSGYVSHVPQTLALLEQALAGRSLTRLINTHSHSDHIGGNAAVVSAHGCRVSVPLGMAGTVARWDRDVLHLTTADQRAEPFAFDDTIDPDQRVSLGGMDWRTVAAPGHDMEALIFHCESERILISGDALWRDGFGILFSEVLGEPGALAAARDTLETIGRLSVDVVIPGHGAPFIEFEDALGRAFGRVRAFEEDPARMARNALRACVSFSMMDLRRMRRAAFADYLQQVPLFREANRKFLGMQPGALADWLAAELMRAGTLREEGEWLIAS